MKFQTARCLLLAFALSGSAFAQAPIEAPVVPSPVEHATDQPAETEVEEAESVAIPHGAADQVSTDVIPIQEFQADEIGLVIRTLARQAKMSVVVSDEA